MISRTLTPPKSVQVLTRLQELQTTISASESHRQSTLQSIAKKLDTWAVHVQREKAVYYQMNMLNMDVTHQGLVAEAWVPRDAVGRVQVFCAFLVCV